MLRTLSISIVCLLAVLTSSQALSDDIRSKLVDIDLGFADFNAANTYRRPGTL